MKSKIRYSFPGRIYELLLTDDKFLQDVFRIKKKIENSFPRYDQWKDDTGFHVSFALAGYSQGDVSLTIIGRQIILSASGLEDLTTAEVTAKDPSEVGEEDKAPTSVHVHKGYVSRGIARRSFKTHLFISEEFDLSGTEAKMEHGLLHIFIPEITIEERTIKIK